MARDFKTIGVVGLGTMGAGITEVFARHGYTVVGVEVDDDAVERGRQHLEHSTSRAVSRGKLSEDDAKALHEALSLATLVAIAVHGAALLGDHFLHPTLLDISVPFTGGYRPFWTGLGIAAGWAFYDIKCKGIAPKALVFGVTNPVMVQGAVFAEMTITEGWSRPLREVIRTGDWVRVDPARRMVELLRRA